MLSPIGLIHLFCCPYYYKTASYTIFLSSPLYQEHTNKQLVSLADSCITHYFERLCKIPLILYYESISRDFPEEYAVKIPRLLK